jgi:diguanylate cyclase (GGDEF)-like protein
MSSPNQTPGNTTQALKLLLVGGSNDTVTQCETLLNGIDTAFQLDHAASQATLAQALTDQKCDLVLIDSTHNTVEAAPVLTSMAEHNVDASPLILAEELADEVALTGLQAGAYNVVSLKHHEHFQLTIQREIRELTNRRQLYQLAIEIESLRASSTQASNKKDLLTNLYTQQFFTAGSEKIFKKTPPDSHTQHGALIIKLDKLDTIRQQLGIAVGDIIIAEIANCIRDYIPVSYPVARFDDHHFAVLIQKSTFKKIESAANAICKKVAEHTIEVAGINVPTITCSIGIALTCDSVNQANQLISKAQMAAKAASVTGGNQSHLFDPENDEQYGLAIEQQIEQQWQKRIHAALKENRFKLLYQPVVSLQSNTAENYELLLRMLDENHKEIMPAEFMPIAAQVGLMPAIDRWVTHHAIAELSDRRRGGKDTSFFIKLDHTTLSDTGFHSWLGEQLRKHQMPADALVFEISEQSDLKAPHEVIRFMTQLKALHCRCALDHFGSNDTSIDRQQRLPLDFIKIDRSLIQRINTEPKIQAKVKQLVNNAHENEQKAIAEFVQEASTLSALWSCKMDYIQGYFLQRPDSTMDYDFTEEN